jgi:hypothetical protein
MGGSLRSSVQHKRGAHAQRRRRLLFGGLAVFMVIALAAGVATRGHLWGPRKADNAVTAADPRDLGAGVMVVSGQVPDGLQARVVAGGMKVDKSLARPVGKTVDVGPSGKLAAPLTLQLTLSRLTPKGAAVIVFTRPGGKGAWKPLETKLTADRRHALVAVNHLSWLSPLLVPFKGIVNELKEIFNDLTSGVVEDAKQPSCDHEQEAKEAGYTAVRSGADTLLWCLDEQDGKGALRTVNSRRYPLLLAHKGLDRLSGAISNNVSESISRRLAFDGTVLYPSDDATFGADLPRGQRVTVESTYDGVAQAFGSLYVGVRALLTILSKFGADNQPSKVLEVIDKLLLADACARSRTAGDLLANCFNPKQLMEAFGTALGAILVPIVTVSSVMDYFQGAIQALWDQWEDRSDTELTLARAADMGRFVGQWYVHGWQLEIRADRSATTTWNAGPCGPVTCTGHGELRVWPSGGNLVLKYERTWLTANPGNNTVPDDWGTVPDPTGLMELAWREPGLLERVDPNPPPANPYWCGEGLDPSQQDKCGA